MLRLLASITLFVGGILISDQSLEAARSFCGEFIETIARMEIPPYEFQRRIHKSLDYEVERKIPDDVVAKYEERNNLKLTVQLDEDLFHFLRRNHLDVDKLQYIGDGSQGVVFIHPDLPNRAIKVWKLSTEAPLNPVRMKRLPAPFILAAPDWSVSIHKPWFLSADRIQYQEEQLIAQKSKNIFLPELSIRRAGELIEFSSFIHDLKLPYLDAVRIHHLGNYFMIRDYFQDAEVGLKLTDKTYELADEVGIDFLEESLKITHELCSYQGLRPLFGYFAGGSQTYCSPTEFRASFKTGKPRLVIVFDMN